MAGRQNAPPPIHTTGAAGPSGSHSGPPTQGPATPLYVNPPTQLIPWNEEKAIADHGLNFRNYFNYQVPWNGGITVGEWIKIYALLPPKQQKPMVDEWMISLAEYYDLTLSVVNATSDIFSKNEALMALYGGAKIFQERYPIMTMAKDQGDKRRKEMESAVNTVRNIEPEITKNILAPYSHATIMSHTGSTAMAFLLQRFPFQALVPHLNAAYYRRRTNTARSQDSHVNATDWMAVKEDLKFFGAHLNKYFRQVPAGDIQTKALNRARNLGFTPEMLEKPKAYRGKDKDKAKDDFFVDALNWYATTKHAGRDKTLAPPVPDEWLVTLSLTREPEYGFIVPLSAAYGSKPTAEERHRVTSQAEFSALEPLATSVELGGRGVVIDDSDDRFFTPLPEESRAEVQAGKRIRSQSLSAHSKYASPGSDVTMGSASTERTPQEEIRRLEGRAHTQRNLRIAKNLQSTLPKGKGAVPPVRPRARETPLRDRDTMQSTLENRLQLENLDENAEFENEVDEEIDPKAAHTASTSAACGCTNQGSILISMLKKMQAGRKLGDPARVRLIDEWYRESFHYEENCTPNPARVCYNHLQFTSSKMGLVTRTAGQNQLREELFLLYRSKHKWGQIQSDPVTGTLFTQPFRKVTASDLKSYRYAPKPIRASINWDTVAEQMGWVPMLEKFQKVGTVVLDCFDWIFQDKELNDILDDCYNMYDYHTRMIDGKSNLGWCRTMYHSVIQQLVRGDPLYWLYYAVIRKEPFLVSYPYYTKYTKPGDRTYFRHVDLNISEAVKTGRGVDMIQGSVSWDKENEANCTEMLDGFHNIIGDYQAWREDSGKKDSTGYIEGWTEKADWPEEVQDRFPNVKWKKHVCKPGQVRISDPRIPHGSTGDATSVRRTMLPWFVRVHDDMTTMEVPDMGSYQEIATAYQQCTAAPKTPSGHSNRYGGVNWAFPGDIVPHFTSAISRAVNCQLRWDSPLVQEELSNLFAAPDRGEISDWIKKTRADTAAMVKRHWKICIATEKHAYGADDELNIPNRSFFVNKGKHPTRGKEWWEYDGQVEQSTAMSRLRDTYALPADSRSVSREGSQAAWRRSSSVLTPTSQLRSDTGSPMDVEPSTPRQRTRVGTLSYHQQTLDRTPEHDEEDEEGQSVMSPTARRGPGPSTPGVPLRKSQRLVGKDKGKDKA
jgi:hypothetical protein